MLNKEKMIEILQEKIDSGYAIIEGLSISDKEYGAVVMNMFETAKTIEQLNQEINFDKEMNKEVEVEKALSKNEEVVL